MLLPCRQKTDGRLFTLLSMRSSLGYERTTRNLTITLCPPVKLLLWSEIMSPYVCAFSVWSRRLKIIK